MSDRWKTIGLMSVATLMLTSVAAHAEIAGGVVGCDAPGNKQVGGAVIGALLGGVAGSNLAKHDRTAGTVVGATAGAATGSYVGCRMQKADANRQEPQPRRTVERDDDRRYVGEDDRRYAGDDDHRYAGYDRDEGPRGVPPGLAKKPHGMPPGQAKKYYGVGERLPVAYVQPSQYLRNERRYGLRAPPPGYRWVIVERDAYLVRTRSGVITEVIRAIMG